jgi:hypothetical protein
MTMFVGVGSTGIPSKSMPFKDRWAILAASKAVTKAIACCVTLVLAAVLQADLSRAEDRSKAYLNDMRIMACVTAENAVRARLKDQGQVSFESCASSKFDIDLAADDRDYKVFGYATILSPDVASVTKRFFVRINHDPDSYGDWGFEVTKVEIDP